jgi:hypothetical protein
VAVVDVNSDSKPDIIVANYGNNTVSVLLNTGNGTFSAQKTYSIGAYPYSVAVVDVNSDSKPDIIVVNSNDNTVVFFSTQVTAHLVHKQLTQLALTHTVWPWSMSIATANPTLLSLTLIVTTSVFSWLIATNLQTSFYLFNHHSIYSKIFH